MSRIRIAFVGPMGSGKTTAAVHLKKNYGFTKYSIADKLKEICIDLYDMKEKDRVLLQTFGTECVRRVYPDTWVNYVLRKIKEDGYSRVVIDDCRFLNEAKILRDNSFWIIRLINSSGKRDATGLNETTAKHPSETEQEEINADLTIIESSVEDLQKTLDDRIHYIETVEDKHDAI